MRSFGPHYRLQVLNAESFEEKLTSVYKELEISPDDYLPVNYRVENEMLYVQMFKACFGITGVCTTEYHSTTEYQFFYFSYKILRKRAI